MKKLIVGALAAISIALGVAPPASAYGYDAGCETIRWGFLGSQWRTVCDGPRRPDGSWERERTDLDPGGLRAAQPPTAARTPAASSGGYYREESTTGYGALRGVRRQRTARRAGLAPRRGRMVIR